MTGILVAIAFMALFTLLAYNRFILMRKASDKILSGMDPLVEARDERIRQWMRQVPEPARDSKSLWKQLQEQVTLGEDNPLTADQKVTRDNLIREIVQQLREKEAPAAEADPAGQQLHALDEKERELDAHRQSYNDTTTEYNNAIMLFPSNVFAVIFTFKTRKLFRGL